MSNTVYAVHVAGADGTSTPAQAYASRAEAVDTVRHLALLGIRAHLTED